MPYPTLPYPPLPYPPYPTLPYPTPLREKERKQDLPALIKLPISKLKTKTKTHQNQIYIEAL